VRGEAGIGKSSLLRSFLRACPPSVEIVLSTAQDDGVPFRPVHALLERLGVDVGTETAMGNGPGEIGLQVARAVAGRSIDRTVIVAVDDVHLADPASCAVLQAVIADCSDRSIAEPVRLLVLLTVREHPDGQRPADGMLRALGTTHEPVEMVVGRLDEHGVAALMFQESGSWPAPLDARRVLAATGGHPMVVRLAARGDRAAPPAGGSLDAAVDRRLGELPPAAHAVLEACAVVDEPFDLDLVENGLGVVGVADRLADPDLDGIVLRENNGWRFTHGAFRDRILAARGARRRAELHRLAADALLRRGDDDAVLRADHHLDAAGPVADGPQRRAVAVRAGAIAAARGAWTRSADTYVVALGPHLEHAGELDGDTLIAAGQALIRDSQPRAAEPVLDLALARVESPERALELATLAVRIQLMMSRLTGRSDLLERLHALVARSDLPPALRCEGWVALADVAYLRGDRLEGMRCCAEASRLANETHDAKAQAMAAYAEGLQLLGALRVREARRLFLDVPRRGLGELDPVQVWWRVRAGVSAFHAGMTRDASRRLNEGASLASRVGRIGEQALAATYRSALAMIDGDRVAARALGWHAVRLMRRSAYPPAQAAYPQLVQLAVYAGDAGEAAATIASMTRDAARVPAWLEALAYQGSFPDQVRAPGATSGSSPRPEHLARLAVAVESADGDGPALRAAAGGLQSAFDAGTLWTTGWVASVPRLLGLAALRMGSVEDADRWLRAAEAAVARDSVERILVDRVWIGVHTAAGRATEADLARHRALSAADSAGWSGLTEWIVADAPVPAPSVPQHAGARVLLFTDMVDSTGINVRVGDRRFVGLLEAHNRVIREAAARFRGVVFHNTGDGYGVWFVSADDAARCAHAIHDGLCGRADGEELSVRIGIAAGSAMALDGDLFGVDVVRAARLCALAPARGTYVDATVAADVARSLEIRSLGPVALKGFPHPEDVFLLVPARP
jgi:class 3 adenylate cyclase